MSKNVYFNTVLAYQSENFRKSALRFQEINIFRQDLVRTSILY